MQPTSQQGSGLTGFGGTTNPTTGHATAPSTPGAGTVHHANNIPGSAPESDAPGTRPTTLDSSGISDVQQPAQLPAQLRGGRHAFVSGAAAQSAAPVPKTTAADCAGDDSDNSTSLLAPMDISFVFGDSGFTDVDAAADAQQKATDQDMAKVANSRVQQYLAQGKKVSVSSSAAASMRGQKGANELEGSRQRPAAPPAAAFKAPQPIQARTNMVVPGSTTSEQERDRPFHGYGGQYNSLGSLPGSSGAPMKSFPVATGDTAHPAAATRAEISPQAQPDTSSLDDAAAHRHAARFAHVPRSDQELRPSSSDADGGAAGTFAVLLVPLCSVSPRRVLLSIALCPVWPHMP